MTRVKICGITNREDAQAAVAAGADALGFVFADSPRWVSAARAREIVDGLPPFITAVGVFVDAAIEQVQQTREQAGLDLVQCVGYVCYVTRIVTGLGAALDEGEGRPGQWPE